MTALSIIAMENLERSST